MPPIKTIIMTDFDGTATGIPGAKLVFSRFYNSLLSGGQGNYKNTPMLDWEGLQAAFEKEFNGHRDDPRLLSQAAENFFHDALADESVRICINTKNRTDYIIAMLRYLHFREDEIARIDIQDNGKKGMETTAYLNKIQGNIQDNARLIILDDSKDDHDAMVNAAKSHNATTQKHLTIHSHRKDPGNFGETWESLSERLAPELELDPSTLTPLERPKRTLIDYSFALKLLRAFTFMSMTAAFAAVIIAAFLFTGGTAGLLIGAGIAVGLGSGYGFFKSEIKIQTMTPKEAAYPLLTY